MKHVVETGPGSTCRTSAGQGLEGGIPVNGSLGENQKVQFDVVQDLGVFPLLWTRDYAASS